MTRAKRLLDLPRWSSCGERGGGRVGAGEEVRVTYDMVEAVHDVWSDGQDLVAVRFVEPLRDGQSNGDP